MLMPLILQRPLLWLTLALVGMGLISAGTRRPLEGQVPPFSYGLMLTGGMTRDPVRLFAALPASLTEKKPEQWACQIGSQVTVLTGLAVARNRVRLPLWPGFPPPPAPAVQNPPIEMATLSAEVLVVRVPARRLRECFAGLLKTPNFPWPSGPFLLRGAGVGEQMERADLSRSLGFTRLPDPTWLEAEATLVDQARLLRSLVFVNDAAWPVDRQPLDDKPNWMLLAPQRPLHLASLQQAVRTALGEHEEVQITALGTQLPFASFALIWLGQGILLLGAGLFVMSLIFVYADELMPEGWLPQRWHACTLVLSERWGLYLILLGWTTFLFQGLELLAYFMPELHDYLTLVTRWAESDFPGANALHHFQLILVLVLALSAAIPSAGVLTGLVYTSFALWAAPVNDLPLPILLLGSGSVVLELHTYVIAMVGACCVLEGLLAPSHFDVTENAAGYLEGVRTMFRLLWLIALFLLILTGYEAIGHFLIGEW